ncbi:DUF397 domain-containing protein [Streptomyces longispororuber]|uniref:DUF397 domain-containing protein n=1 Tax=Streptomyces longispororuber TaxID=68230 RepID=UPI00167C9578|nr:DUF397 domain-containing protein [Streptomyces longispororuber]
MADGSRWRKSSYSGSSEECVEVYFGTLLRVRDSRCMSAGNLTYTASAWRYFLAALKRSEEQ